MNHVGLLHDQRLQSKGWDVSRVKPDLATNDFLLFSVTFLPKIINIGSCTWLFVEFFVLKWSVRPRVGLSIK